jgi:hypothetical protein
MNDGDGLENVIVDGEAPSDAAGATCPVVSIMQPGINLLSPDVCCTLKDAGCPLATDMNQRLQFETLLTDLSSKFVNVSANQVDSHIQWRLTKKGVKYRIEQVSSGRPLGRDVDSRPNRFSVPVAEFLIYSHVFCPTQITAA